MSQKITSKNLSYDSSLPPFLARIQAQASGQSGPDPILSAQRRAAKKRSGSEEAEDAPLVVDEEGNAINFEVGKDGTVKDNRTGEPDAEVTESAEPEKATQQESEAKAAIGGRKRKVGKVIGDAADESAAKAPKENDRNGDKPPKDRRPKKKAKKIKLSFDEDGG